MKKLFVFRTPHCQAAEEWLNMQAKEGWALEKISLLSFAHFTRTETPRQYAVRIGPAPSWSTKDEFEEYRNFFASFGWKHIVALQRMHILEADLKSEPLESDVEAEAIGYLRYHKRSLGITIGILLLLLFFIFIGFVDMSVIAFFTRPFYLSVLVFAVIAAVMCLDRAIRYWRYKRHSKQAIAKGLPLPALSLSAAYRIGIISMAGGILLYTLWILIAIWDAILSPLHSNILISIAGPMVGSFTGILSYRKWDFKKGSFLKTLPIIAGVLIFVGVLVYVFMPSPRDMSITNTEDLPVLHMPGASDEYNYYYYTATPLMSQYEYMEYPNGKYYGSLCVDSATYTLSNIAFKDVAYNVRFGGPLRHAEDFEPYDFPGADSAIINRQAGLLVLRYGKRVVGIKWRYGFDASSDMRYFERVREVFLG